MNQNRRIDALESFLVAADSAVDANKESKKLEQAIERSEALDTPYVGDDLAAYRKASSDDRERQFVATLKLVQDLRQQASLYNEKIAGVDCLFGDAVHVTFDYLALLYNDSHPVQLQKVQEIAIATWMKIATRFNSQPLAKAFLAYLKALLHVTEQLMIGLETQEIYLERDFLMTLITDKGVAKTTEGLEAVRGWKTMNTEHGGADFEQRNTAMHDFIEDVDDVFDKAAAIATVFVELAPSVVLDKAMQAMKTAAYHALCQVVYLYAALQNRYQMEFYTNQLTRAKGRERERKFMDKIVELEAVTAQNEVDARMTREKAVEHLKSVGLSVARKSQLNN